MKPLPFAAGIAACVFAPVLAQAKERSIPQIQIQEPYVELRSAPGRAYPVFDIAERGETVQLLRLRTGWYKLRTPRGEGWVHSSQLQGSLQAAP